MGQATVQPSYYYYPSNKKVNLLLLQNEMAERIEASYILLKRGRQQQGYILFHFIFVFFLGLANLRSVSDG